MLWSYQARNTDEAAIVDRLVAPHIPVVVTDLTHRIVGVNRSWVHMCKFSHEEAFGQSPKMLQGPATDMAAAREFANGVCRGSVVFACLVNYKKDGSTFRNHLVGWAVGDLLIAETFMNGSQNQQTH